ncbi:MAG: hypothetical protein ACK55I_20505, partial [bacterium]
MTPLRRHSYPPRPDGPIPAPAAVHPPREDAHADRATPRRLPGHPPPAGGPRDRRAPRRLRRAGDPQPEPRGGGAARHGIGHPPGERLRRALGDASAAHR